MPQLTYCGECKWCVYNYDSKQYECHLHPPQMDELHDPGGRWGWRIPVVDVGQPVCSDSK